MSSRTGVSTAIFSDNLVENILFSSNLEFESSRTPQKDPNEFVACHPQIPFKLVQISQTAHTTTILNAITLVPSLFKTLKEYVHLTHAMVLVYEAHIRHFPPENNIP